VRFVHLRTSADVLASRLTRRRSHFVSASLLPSQLATLEEPAEDELALIVDGARPVPDLVAEIVQSLDRGGSNHA
jgi:gluconokinase